MSGFLGGNKEYEVRYGIPRHVTTQAGELTVYLYPGSEDTLFDIFGGGFVTGCAEYEDGICAYLQKQTGCTVVACSYYLAPSYRFPVQTEQVYETVKQLRGPGRTVLIGHSAGATCAAGVAALAGRRQEFSVDGVVMNYPLLDLSIDPAERPRREGNLLKDNTMRGFAMLYLEKDEDALDPVCSPLLLSDGEIGRFPPSYLLTCSMDNLRSDAIAFARRLREAGREYVLTEADAVHGFLEEGMHGWPKSLSPDKDAALAETEKEARWIARICGKHQ